MRWFWISVLAVLLMPVIAAAGVVYDEAEVVDVTPIYEAVRISEPHEVCYDQRVRVDHHGPRGHGYASGTAPILGGIIGGIIGSAVGDTRSNRRVGAVAGALLGASVARDVAHRRRDARSPQPVRFRTEEVCEVRYEYREEERLIGYRVTFEYAGERFTTRTRRHPGDTVPVRVRVTPV